MTEAELPNHLLYMLVFGGLALVALIALAIELGTRAGKRRFGMIAWSVLGVLVGGLFLVINLANVLTESGPRGVG